MPPPRLLLRLPQWRAERGRRRRACPLVLRASALQGFRASGPYTGLGFDRVLGGLKKGFRFWYFAQEAIDMLPSGSKQPHFLGDLTQDELSILSGKYL